MAPTRVTKSEVSPKKGPNTSTSKTALSEQNLLFLWHCVHNSKGNAQPDFKAVAEKMNIVPGTAYYRYNQLKSYFENMGVTYGGAEKESAADGPKTPETPKTPKTPRNKTPKKVNNDDELENELKPAFEMKGVVIKEEEEKPELAIKLDDSDT